MIWENNAPANIALIKYMGKNNSQKNIPTNSSISYSLDHCQTFVKLELTDNKHDSWRLLENQGLEKTNLSEKGIQRFLNHFSFLKNQFGIQQNFIIYSANNFPSDCGLASSASSYAALTKTACAAFSDLTKTSLPDLSIQANLSRQGSGSSCRSFFSPWAIWQNEEFISPKLSYDKLIHQVVLVASHKKTISSSLAHQLVTSSELFLNRPQRAEKRLQELLNAFNQNDWQKAYVICWQEFFDMHALFETCAQPFGYITPDTIHVLQTVRDFWQQHQDGPIVTLDAGPNVHLLYRLDQQKIAEDLAKIFQTQFKMIQHENYHF